MQRTVLASQARILIVESETVDRSVFADTFEKEYFQVTCVPDGSAALVLLVREASFGSPFDLVVSELCSNDCDTVAFLEAARSQHHAPAVILIGIKSADSILLALRLGAADYLPTPFEPDQLQTSATAVLARRQKTLHRLVTMDHIIQGLAQLHNLAQHQYVQTGSDEDRASGSLTVGVLRIDTERQTIQWQGQPCSITPIEYALLRCLAATPGHTQSYREIVSWTHNRSASDTQAMRLLKSHVRNLRHKLAPELIANIKGVGYALRVIPVDQQITERTL